MGDVKQWLSVKIQRALGFESVNDVADIVSSIMAKSDAKDIESNLRVRACVGLHTTIQQFEPLF